MLLDQLSDGDWVNTLFVCRKMSCSIWQKILTGLPYKWKALLPFDFICGKIALFHLQKVLTGFSVQMENTPRLSRCRGYIQEFRHSKALKAMIFYRGGEARRLRSLLRA